MDFGEAVKTCFSKYVTFSGRAPRSEYWWFMLFLLLAQLALGVLDAMAFGDAQAGPLGMVFGLAVCLPAISVTVRRLHDIGRSGWWWWLYLLPIIGAIVLLVFACLRSQPGANRFGPNPLTGDADVAEVFS